MLSTLLVITLAVIAFIAIVQYSRYAYLYKHREVFIDRQAATIARLKTRHTENLITLRRTHALDIAHLEMVGKMQWMVNDAIVDILLTKRERITALALEPYVRELCGAYAHKMPAVTDVSARTYLYDLLEYTDPLRLNLLYTLLSEYQSEAGTPVPPLRTQQLQLDSIQAQNEAIALANQAKTIREQEALELLRAKLNEEHTPQHPFDH